MALAIAAPASRPTLITMAISPCRAASVLTVLLDFSTSRSFYRFWWAEPVAEQNSSRGDEEGMLQPTLPTQLEAILMPARNARRHRHYGLLLPPLRASSELDRPISGPVSGPGLA